MPDPMGLVPIGADGPEGVFFARSPGSGRTPCYAREETCSLDPGGSPPRSVERGDIHHRRARAAGAELREAERRREEGYCVPDRAREAPWSGNPPTAVAYPNIQLNEPNRAVSRADGSGDSGWADPRAGSPPDPPCEGKEFA